MDEGVKFFWAGNIQLLRMYVCFFKNSIKAKVQREKNYILQRWVFFGEECPSVTWGLQQAIHQSNDYQPQISLELETRSSAPVIPIQSSVCLIHPCQKNAFFMGQFSSLLMIFLGWWDYTLWSMHQQILNKGQGPQFLIGFLVLVPLVLLFGWGLLCFFAPKCTDKWEVQFNRTTTVSKFCKLLFAIKDKTLHFNALRSLLTSLHVAWPLHFIICITPARPRLGPGLIKVLL